MRRIEAQRAGTEPAQRQALMASALPRYREYAAALAAAHRGAEAYAAAELAKARLLLDLTAVGAELELRTPPVDELKAMLPPRSLYLGYVVQRNVLLVTVLSAEHGGAVHRIAIPPGFSASIAAWRFLLAIPEEWRGKIAGLPKVWRRKDGSFQAAAKPPERGAHEAADADEIAAWLGERLLGPATRHLGGAHRIIVSPDADLAFVPFEALRLEGRYLVETHEVQYTAGAAMYALSRARAGEYARRDGGEGLLAVGGALYEPFVQVTPMLNVHHELLYGPPPAGKAAGTLAEAFRARKVVWANLPGTAEEATRVAALFARGRALTAAEASEKRLAEMSASGELARYRHLFFATHGYLSPHDARLSSVVLSQMGNAAPYDGYVTAGEWPRYALKSDLVLVAGSNSGFGPVAGAEGLLGLPFALHLAGNRNTVLSLWTLNDPHTSRLVREFFTLVRERSDHVAALAAAKRALVDEGVPASYWAAFVLHGS